MSEPASFLTQTEPGFEAIVHIEAEGGYWAEVPELPGCFTQGDTLDEIQRNLTEAITCHCLSKDGP